MHQTRITRDMVYRAVMLRERFCAMKGPPHEMVESDQKGYIALSRQYHAACEEASLAVDYAMGELLNILAEEMGIDIQAIRRR